MSVQTQIDRINSSVSEQSSIITQITDALEGKAAGGSVETCTLSLYTYTDSAKNVQYVYVDENDELVYYEHNSAQFDGSLIVKKGLFIVMPPLEASGLSYVTVTGGVELVQTIEVGNVGAIFNITGDGSIRF